MNKKPRLASFFLHNPEELRFSFTYRTIVRLNSILSFLWSSSQRRHMTSQIKRIQKEEGTDQIVNQRVRKVKCEDSMKWGTAWQKRELLSVSSFPKWDRSTQTSSFGGGPNKTMDRIDIVVYVHFCVHRQPVDVSSQHIKIAPRPRLLQSSIIRWVGGGWVPCGFHLWRTAALKKDGAYRFPRPIPSFQSWTDGQRSSML